MQTITLETDIAQDGTLAISFPSGLPPGKVEVVLVIQPKVLLNQSGIHEQLAEASATKTNTQVAYVNGSNQNDVATRLQQGKRMMQLLAVALKGVEWHEIEEGRVDDVDRC